MLAGYWRQTLSLGPDPDGEGEIFATLVRRGDRIAARHAVLVVHGFTDYFFHTELADHFAGRGFAFYALDMHKCGRSWREGQTPHFTTNLRRYDAELDWALEVIAEETGGQERSDPGMCWHPAPGCWSPARGSPAAPCFRPSRHWMSAPRCATTTQAR